MGAIRMDKVRGVTLLLRIGCWLRGGHDYIPCEWTARGVSIRACCLRCFKEKTF